MSFEICNLPPCKEDFLNALYYIYQNALTEAPFEPIGGDGPPKEWLQFVADKVSPPCKHPECTTRPQTALALMDECHLDLPPIYLSLDARDQPFYAQKRTYSREDCCSLDKLGVLKGDMLFYGTLASHHLLQKEVQEVTIILHGRLREIREEWRSVFFREMYELLELKSNPQDRAGQ